MSRALTTLAVFATLLLGCASGSRSAIRRGYDAAHADQIRLTVRNYVHRDVTVYVMVNGQSSRIGRCSMGSTCNWWLTPKLSDSAERQGGITLAWRWAAERAFVPNADGSAQYHGNGSIAVWANMEIILQLNTTSWTIYPGIDNVKEA